MKVTMDETIYKGSLYYLSDSNIRILTGINIKDLPVMIAVQHIQQNNFKRKHALIKMFSGAF